MALHQYSQAARKRIARAVQWTETQTTAPFVQRRRGTAYPMAKLVQAYEDIEHGQIGDVNHLEGPAFGGSISLVSGDTAFPVYNPGPKIWSGSELIISQIALPGEDETNEARWYVSRAWSATRIRGKTTTTMAPGSTTNCTVVQRIDGHFAPSSASVYMPTQFVSIEADRVVWYELAYVTASSSSRWEVYSADCDGGA